MRWLHLGRCPRCGGDLQARDREISCCACSQAYPVDRGLPLLYWPHYDTGGQSVIEVVKAFYERNPFPRYEPDDDIASLMDKACQGVFARLLDEQIPFKTRVLDCGCGTGQLSNFLGVAQRSVFGTDICANSLALALEFREKHQLDRVTFLQMNLFRPVFRPETFDFVICNGVLHHTEDPRGGFRSLAQLVKPGGYLIVGLYHRWGRLGTDMRRVAMRVGGRRLAFLDPRIRSGQLGANRKEAWLADQYFNPHESKHTVSQVLRWLPEAGLDFVKSLPKTRLGSQFSPKERLFDPETPGATWERALTELSQVFRGAAENGFFVVVARKSHPPRTS